MLRICGITFVHTTNYGTCFQAYALQKAINGISVGNNEKCELRFVPFWRCNDHFSSKQNSFFYSIYLRRFKRIQEDEIKYVSCNSLSNLSSLNDYFDAFVCGSDVIWNPRFNHELGLYYLDFAKKYKFSYAPSFGNTNIGDEVFLKVGRWISDLNDISVREQSSVEIVKKYTSRDSQVVADPVILLNSEEWNHLLCPKHKKTRYIFSYSTHYTSEYHEFLNRLSEETGLKIIKASWIKSMKAAINQGILMIQTPEEWLRLIRDAEFVVTNSFHATVFSTIFHKRFFTVVHGQKNEGANFRMYDFLHTIGLQERIYSSVPSTINLTEIDFSNSDDIVKKMRNDGIQYLRKNLEAAYEQKVSNFD